jgi:hypothetical protein
MAVSVSLPNARSYQREAIVLLGGGALSGIVAFVLAQVAGSQHIELMALSFGATVGLLANLADPKEGTPMLRLVLSILGGAVMAIAWSFQPIFAGALGGLFIGAGASLGEGKNHIEGAWNWLLYGCALALGVFVTQRVGMTVFEGSEFGQDLFQGAVWGLFLAFSAGLKRLEFLRDELRSEFAEAEAEVKGLEKDNIIAGRVLYERIVIETEKTESSLQDRALEIASETSRALIAFSRRSDELRQAAEVTSGRQLKKRILEVDARLLATKDSQVSKELRTVLDELGEQLRVRSRLEVARARLEARQQRCLTSLERLHVTLLQGSGSSSQDSSLQESIESLERLSDELHWQNLSVEELVKDSDVAEELTVDQLLQSVRQEPEGVVLSVDTTLDTEDPANEPVASKGADGTDGTVTESEEAHVQTSSH